MNKPETNYAKSGRVSIAYQVFGSGPIDLVYVPGWISEVDQLWEDPEYARFMTRIGFFARVITFDKRGTGQSDRDTGYLTLEERMEDLRAVMDAAGSPRAAILGLSEGGSMSILFAATYPARTAALILYGAFAKRVWSEDYPWAPTPSEREAWIKTIEENWGRGKTLAGAPSRANDPSYARWRGELERRGASPSTALVLARTNTNIDVRAVLPTI